MAAQQTEQALAHMTHRFSGLRWLGACMISALVLGGCSEQDNTILPGIREGLREVLDDSEIDAAVENRSAPISLGATQTNASWAQPWGSPSLRTAHPALSSSPQLLWARDIGAGDGRRQRISAEPVVGGGRVYTLDASAQVSAVTPGGDLVWSRDLTPPTDGAGEATGGGLAYADGRIYVSLGFGTVSALDAASGEVIWTQGLDATGSGAPTVSGDLVYLVSGDDTGWALETSNGRVRWQLGSASSVTNVLGAPAPAVTDDLAIFAFGNGSVQAVFRRGGLRRWESAIVGERRGFALAEIDDITAPPVVDKGRIYVGNQAGRTVALSAGGGKRIWTAKEGASGPLWPAGDSVFMVSDRNELLRLSAETGERIWGTGLPNFVRERPRRRTAVHAHYGPVVAGGRVVVLGSDGQMRNYSPVDGSFISEIEIPGGAATAPAIAGGVLYVLSTRGQLLAYR